MRTLISLNSDLTGYSQDALEAELQHLYMDLSGCPKMIEMIEDELGSRYIELAKEREPKVGRTARFDRLCFHLGKLSFQ